MELLFFNLSKSFIWMMFFTTTTTTANKNKSVRNVLSFSDTFLFSKKFFKSVNNFTASNMRLNVRAWVIMAIAQKVAAVAWFILVGKRKD